MRLRLILMTLAFVCSGWQVTPGKATAQAPKVITNSIGMKLVLIPKGTFTMGSPPSELNSEDDERQHEVTLTRDYYLGAFEVTQGAVCQDIRDFSARVLAANSVSRHQAIRSSGIPTGTSGRLVGSA